MSQVVRFVLNTVSNIIVCILCVRIIIESNPRPFTPKLLNTTVKRGCACDLMPQFMSMFEVQDVRALVEGRVGVLQMNE
jgi:hypothetical protein